MENQIEVIPSSYNGNMDDSEQFLSQIEEEKRSEEDRRKLYFGRRDKEERKILELTKLEQKLDSLQIQMNKLSLDMARSDVQNERIQNLLSGLEGIKRNQDLHQDRINLLQQAHDRCEIHELKGSMDWLKRAIVWLIGIVVTVAGSSIMFLLNWRLLIR